MKAVLKVIASGYSNLFKKGVLSNAINNNYIELKSISSVQILDKNISVYKRGSGEIPLLIVGPANLFRKPRLLPTTFDSVFTIYFVDIFEKTQNNSSGFAQLSLNDFTSLLDSIREQLGLKKIALFGHSANGILALEYANNYPEKVLLNIIVGTAPIWGNYKSKLINGYFQDNSSTERQQLFKADQEQFMKNTESNPAGSGSFIANYNARRAQFYYCPTVPAWKLLWDGLNMDEALVNHYFSLIKNYDVREKYLNPSTPTFLGLGLYDYSCPFYGWTEDAKAQLAGMEHYIFEESGHYPQVEQATLFSEKLFEYMESKKLIAASRDEHFGVRPKL